MDVDRMSYIFGSFSRKNLSQNVSPKEKKSTESKKIFHSRSKSTRDQPKKTTNSVSRAKSVSSYTTREERFKCPICKQQFVEPIVLPCLHTFCVNCLRTLERKSCTIWHDHILDQGISNNNSRNLKTKNYPNREIQCPICETNVSIPPDGIQAFHLNYPLQHQIVLAALNSRSTYLLCDLCTTDTWAISRCMDCAINFCQECEDMHLRQKYSALHDVLSIDKAREKGITKVRRQIMCTKHPDIELSIFCSTCYQVLCYTCAKNYHKNHSCDDVFHAANNHISDFGLAIDRAQFLMNTSREWVERLNNAYHKIEEQCNKVQLEIENCMNEYLKAVEKHKKKLLEQIQQVREEKLGTILKEKLKFQRKSRDVNDLMDFVIDLMSDKTDVVLLRFLTPVMKRLEDCDSLEIDKSLNVSNKIEFLAEEQVKVPGKPFRLYGAVNTQNVSPENCQLNAGELQNLRVGTKAELLLELYDENSLPARRRGESVKVDVRYKDWDVPKYLDTSVEDYKHGVISINFIPEMVGKLVINVAIKNKYIQGSPFVLSVLPRNLHTGVFHCCSFCSSRGSKTAICACGGRMPGGYKGCGHGYQGHPGTPHWSCCGNTKEMSECEKGTGMHYQFNV